MPDHPEPKITKQFPRIYRTPKWPNMGHKGIEKNSKVENQKDRKNS